MELKGKGVTAIESLKKINSDRLAITVYDAASLEASISARRAELDMSPPSWAMNRLLFLRSHRHRVFAVAAQ